AGTPTRGRGGASRGNCNGCDAPAIYRHESPEPAVRYGAIEAPMGKKSKLRKQMHKRELDESTALVICVGKGCCAREESRALVEATRAYAGQAHRQVPVVTVGCLDICKKGPIAATYPRMKFKKHVTRKRARKLLDKLS